MRALLMRWSGDIRAWLMLFALVRLIGITNPPLETSHHWRQSTVLMVARNFHEDGIDLLRPRVDMAGEKSGITGMEFPLLPAAIAVLADAFGWGHWQGRLIVLLMGTWGAWAFFRLLRRALDERVAFWATLALSASLWFMFGRKTMPDVFALSLVLIGLDAAAACMKGDRPWLHGTLAVLVIALGALSKLPALTVAAVLPFLLFDPRDAGARRWLLSGGLALGMLPVAWWYFVHVPALVRLEGYWHFFMGVPLTQGARELWNGAGKALSHFYFDALRYTGLIAVLAGLVIAVRSRAVRILLPSSFCAALFLLFMLKSGEAFVKHDYYVLPFVPVMALLAGYAIARLPKVAWRRWAMAAVMTEGLLSQVHDLRISSVQAPLRGLEAALDELGPSSDRIAVASGSIPTPLYMAHRKGWTCHRHELERPAFIDSIAALGCTRIVLLDEGYEPMGTIDRPMLARHAGFTIYAAR